MNDVWLKMAEFLGRLNGESVSRESYVRTPEYEKALEAWKEKEQEWEDFLETLSAGQREKLEEIKEMLGSQHEIVSLKEIQCHEDIPEEQDTLEGNALQKARYIHEKYGLDCFADDTGLEIKALNNAPGVYSARYAGNAHDSEANMKKVLQKMQNIPERQARFRTVIALILGDKEYLFEGIVNGEILTSKHGQKGFGYDPIFRPEGFQESFAEMPLHEKNGISHRGQAVRELCRFLNNL